MVDVTWADNHGLEGKEEKRLKILQRKHNQCQSISIGHSLW